MTRSARWTKLHAGRSCTTPPLAYTASIKRSRRRATSREHPDARSKVEVWRVAYDSERPHSSLDYLTPVEFVSLSSWAAACSVRPALEVLAGALARRLRIQNLYRFPLQPSD